MDDSTLSLASPAEVAKAIAARAKAHRLLRGWTQNTLSQRAGITTPSYRRFERTGKASLELVLKVAYALARLDEFNGLLQLPPARSIAELEEQTAQPIRKRGRR